MSTCPWCKKSVEFGATKFKGHTYHKECAKEIQYRAKSEKKVGGMYKDLSSGKRHM